MIISRKLVEQHPDQARGWRWRCCKASTSRWRTRGRREDSGALLPQDARGGAGRHEAVEVLRHQGLAGAHEAAHRADAVAGAVAVRQQEDPERAGRREVGEHQLHAEAAVGARTPARRAVTGEAANAAPVAYAPSRLRCAISLRRSPLPARLARRHHHRRDLADLPAITGADRRAGPGTDRHRRALEVGADLFGTRIRRLRARRSGRGTAGRDHGGMVARQSHRRSVRLAAAAAAVDHLDSPHHPVARHRRTAEGGDRLPWLLDLHPVLHAGSRAASRSAADPRRAQSRRQGLSP